MDNKIASLVNIDEKPKQTKNKPSRNAAPASQEKQKLGKEPIPNLKPKISPTRSKATPDPASSIKQILIDNNKTVQDIPFAPKNGKKYTHAEITTWLNSLVRYFDWQDRKEANKLVATGKWEIVAVKTVSGASFGKHKRLILHKTEKAGN